ncbi:MAG: hypothetical protein ABL984_10040, partial [Pyrinomonadaceae bacterium]
SLRSWVPASPYEFIGAQIESKSLTKLILEFCAPSKQANSMSYDVMSTSGIHGIDRIFIGKKSLQL